MPQDIMSFVDELSRRAAKRKPHPSAPSFGPTDQRVSEPALARREAALTFANRAGARLVAACPACHPDGLGDAAKYVVLVPEANDDAEFRAALAVLRIPYPVVPRRDPLGMIPPKCKHVQEAIDDE